MCPACGKPDPTEPTDEDIIALFQGLPEDLENGFKEFQTGSAYRRVVQSRQPMTLHRRAISLEAP